MNDRKFNPLEHGYERKYCFDFSNNKHITFKNKKPYYFVTDIFATKIKDDIVLVSNEYFPAGSWIKYYKSYGNIDCNSDNSSDSHDD